MIILYFDFCNFLKLTEKIKHIIIYFSELHDN